MTIGEYQRASLTFHAHRFPGVLNIVTWQIYQTHFLPFAQYQMAGSGSGLRQTNLYLDTIMAECSHTGYRFSSSPHQMPILQYADDTCLTASSKANCQAMLNTTQKWLDWSLLKAKVPKCAAISIHGHMGKCTNPHLSISNERIPFLGSKSTSFLGLPVNATLSTDSIKEQLQQKLERYLNLTDQSPLSRQQSLGFTRKSSALVYHGYFPS